jgi:hypothetical protein
LKRNNHRHELKKYNKSDQLKHKYPDVSDDNIIYKCKCIQVDKIKKIKFLILYVVHAHFIDKIEEGENPGPKCL